MANMRTIEIDIEVHKRIESERQTFEETSNDVLRRLLEIAPMNGTPELAAKAEGGWWGDGVFLPNATQLRISYNGKTHVGEVVGGGWRVNGSVYFSPSDAARAVAITKKGKRTNLNGWIYWWVRRPNDPDWVSLSSLRKGATRVAT